jgi:CHAD domain-containing protein
VSYRFKRHESLTPGFVRIAREELEGAISDLGADSGGSPDSEGVHDARRRLKKLRALLRLMRPALGDEVYCRDNSAAREAGRRLSPARDAAVQLATLDGLLDACAEREAEKLSPLRRRIAGEKTRLDRAGLKEAAVNTVIVRLRAMLDGIEAASVQDDSALVCESLCRAYRRARRALPVAKADASDENLHTLRKRVKALYYQLQLLRRVAPKRCKRLLRRLDRLGDDLGIDHDLAVLANALAPDPAIDQEALAELRERVDCQRRKLQCKTFRLAKEVFDKKPSAWLKPFARAWKRWHEPR